MSSALMPTKYRTKLHSHGVHCYLPLIRTWIEFDMWSVGHNVSRMRSFSINRQIGIHRGKPWVFLQVSCIVHWCEAEHTTSRMWMFRQ